MNDAKITQLEDALAQAEHALSVLFQKRQEPDSCLGDWFMADDRVVRGQRELAAAKGEEHAIPVDLGIVPEASVPEPALFQTERDVCLVFNAAKVQPDGIRKDAGCVAVDFELCTLIKFGHPNDEALPGHPLSDKGLQPYGIFEVLGSSWIRSVTELNRVAFPNTPDSSQRHFIFTFHDSTFECIARSVRLVMSSESADQVRLSVFNRLFLTGVSSGS